MSVTVWVSTLTSDPVHELLSAVALFESAGLLLSGVPVNRTRTTVMLSSDSLRHNFKNGASCQ